MNATQAYVAAGFSRKGAAQSAARLLSRADVRARVTELKQEIAASLTRVAIRDKNARLQALQERWEKMHRIVAERAADPGMNEAPGGGTGLLVMTIKSIGAAPLAREVKEFAVDTGLLKEMRAHEEQAARETGDWTEKHEHSGNVNLIERLAAARRRLKETNDGGSKESSED